MIGTLIYKDVIIAVDLFSQKRTAMKGGEVRVLDPNKPLEPQIYEALSGNKWDETMEKLAAELERGCLTDSSNYTQPDETRKKNPDVEWLE